MNITLIDLSVDPALILFLFILQAGVDQEVLVLKNRAFKTPSKEETFGTSGTSIKETGKRCLCVCKIEALMLADACLASQSSLISMLILWDRGLFKLLTLRLKLSINYDQV